MIAIVLIGFAGFTVQGLVEDSREAVENEEERTSLADEFLVLNIDSEGNPKLDYEINITGKFESSSTLVNYKLYRNGNMIDDGTLSGSTASVKKKESPGQGVFRYKYEVLDAEMRKNSSTLTIDNTSTTQPVGALHEGGGQVNTLAWGGTTGSVSIVLPENTLFNNPPPFCIGSHCQESTGNQAPNEGTPKTKYLNRERGDLNGTVKVTDQISIDANEQLCIGSKCEDFVGNAPPSELYGTGQNGDGMMDGPIMIKINGQDPRGIPTSAGGICIGSWC